MFRYCLLQALNIWLSGMKLDAYCLYGLSSIWWGQLAKVIALIASIPIVIDLLGEERIHATSRALSDRVAAFVSRIEERLVRSESTDGFKRFRRIIGSKVFVFGTLFIFLIIVPGFIYLAFFTRFPSMTSSELYAFAPVAFVIYWVVGILELVVLVPIFAFAIFFGVLEGSVVALRDNVLCWYIRAVAVSMLVFAFVLDLLASS